MHSIKLMNKDSLCNGHDYKSYWGHTIGYRASSQWCASSGEKQILKGCWSPYDYNEDRQHPAI